MLSHKVISFVVFLYTNDVNYRASFIVLFVRLCILAILFVVFSDCTVTNVS